MSNARMTLPTLLVLRALREPPEQEMHGLELCHAAGLASGTIHPILARLERLGWLGSRWEDIDLPSRAGHGGATTCSVASESTTLQRL